MAKKTVLPAHQARSRESMRKLLKGATEILGQYGVEGATIPRIARHAGLTPGSVYRRFQDKEALLETAILEILEGQDEKMKTSIMPLATSQVPLPVLAEMLIGGMVTAYRGNAALLRGMRQFIQSRGNTAFYKKASELELGHFRRAVQLFLSYGEEIRHPQPRVGISLALMMVIGTLYHFVVSSHDLNRVKDVLPIDDEALKQELTRAFLCYLGVEAKLGTATMEASRAKRTVN